MLSTRFLADRFAPLHRNFHSALIANSIRRATFASLERRRNGMRTWLVLLLALAVTDTRATTIVLPASKDNSIYSDDVNASNGAGENIFTGANAFAFPRRAFIAFD